MEKWFYWGCLLAFGIRAVQWRHRAHKGLVLSLLLQKGESSGMALKEAGAPMSVYNCLYELEREGLVERRIDDSPLATLSRGGIPRHFFRVRGTPVRSGVAAASPAPSSPAPRGVLN